MGEGAGKKRACETEAGMNLSLSRQVPPWQSHLSSALAGQPNQSGGDQKGIIKTLVLLPGGAHSKATPTLSCT